MRVLLRAGQIRVGDHEPAMARFVVEIRRRQRPSAVLLLFDDGSRKEYGVEQTFVIERDPVLGESATGHETHWAASNAVALCGARLIGLTVNGALSDLTCAHCARCVIP